MTDGVRRCFVHIGAPKTGTTFLQRFFFENREALNAAGVLYPDVSLRGYGHHDLAFLLSGGYPDWATPQPRPLEDLKGELASCVRTARGDMLISSEDFYLFPEPEALLRLLEDTGALVGRRAVIVVYVRRQDLAHESWYNQTIKAQGYDHELGDCVRKFHDLWDYRKQLDRWQSVFGLQSLVVRAYEELQFVDGSLLTDFLGVLGLAAEGFAAPREVVNGGLNYDLLEMQRHINRLPLSVQEKRRFHRELIELSARLTGSGLFDEEPIIDGAMAAEILRSYASGNAEVAQRYCGRSDLFLDAPRPSSESPARHRGLTLEKMVYLFGWLLARQA